MIARDVIREQRYNTLVVCMRRKRGPKSTMLKDRDCDVTPLYYRSLLAPNAPGVGEECEVYCGYG